MSCKLVATINERILALRSTGGEQGFIWPQKACRLRHVPVDYLDLLCFGTSFNCADRMSSPPALTHLNCLQSKWAHINEPDTATIADPVLTVLAASAGQQSKAGLDGDSCTQDTGGSCYFFGCAVRKPSTLLSEVSQVTILKRLRMMMNDVCTVCTCCCY